MAWTAPRHDTAGVSTHAPRSALAAPQRGDTPWLRRFGYQDIQIGHADFDFRFTVKGEDEAAIRALLLPVAVPLLDAVDYVSSVECNGTTVVMIADSRGAIDHRRLPLARLVDAMRALALASR